MITYKDMTFCSKLDCVDKKCDRRITDEALNASKKLGISFSMCDFNATHKCYKRSIK